MSEEQKPENSIPDSVILEIELTNIRAFIEGKSTGKFDVRGPITNEMLSFYMLDKARDIIKAHNLGIALREKQGKIQPAHGIMGFVRKRF